MPSTLLQAWKGTVRLRPEAAALIDGATGRIWTRLELDALAGDWHEKHGRGIKGCAIAFADVNGTRWLEVFLGIVKGGGVALPMDPGDPVAARRQAALSAGASFLWDGLQLEVLRKKRIFRDGRALVKLTSGSTGAPRSFAFTHGQMLADGRHICASMGIRPEDLNFGLIPFGHSYGLGNLVVPLIAQGTPIAFGGSALPHAVAAMIEARKPTVFPAVPPILRALVETSILPAQLRSLRLVISAGAALAPAIAREFQDRFGRRVHGFYGSSETGGITYDRRGDATLSGRSVGKPLSGVRLIFGLRDRFSVESAAVHTIGNRRRRGANGLYRPPDLARLDPSGELVLLGRRGRVVKIGGRRLDLAEVENALRAIPGVQEAFATSHAEKADALAAAIRGSVSASGIRAGLAERLAAWKIPRKILVLPEFPLTSRGKTDTRRLRALLGH